MEKQEALQAEFEYWLNREGITLPADRHTAALADFADLRKHVDIVDLACQADPLPSTGRVLQPGLVPS